MQGPRLKFDNVGLRLGGVEILREVRFEVPSGTVHCVIGPNGGGKTSLIRSLLGQMPHSGTITIEWDSTRSIGYVPQFLDFDKTLPVTVGDFMGMVCQAHRPAFVGMNKATRARVEAALERVGLRGKLRSKLGSLSGGERQRVLFAQALIPEPALLVLDEPMTSMDEIGEQGFLRIIRELADQGVTVVWIAHDLRQVAVTADGVTAINCGVLFSGRPQDVLVGADASVLFAPRRAAS